MKKTWKIGLLLTLFMLLAAAGCGKKEEEAAKQKLIPVALNGTEIRVGETKVQALLDAGFKVTVSDSTEDLSEITQYEIEPEQDLEASTYYSGGTVWISDSVFAHISVATEEAVKMKDAVIARLEFSMPNAEEKDLESIVLDGVPVAEFTREKAGEMYPDFTGDENMWLQYGTDYKYDLLFSQEGKMTGFTLEKEYDVDWTGNNEEK